MSMWSGLGEGVAKKKEAESQHSHMSTDEHRTELLAVLKSKHKEVVSEGLKVIALGVAMFLAGIIILGTEPSNGLLLFGSILVVFVGALLVVLGFVNRYFRE